MEAATGGPAPSINQCVYNFHFPTCPGGAASWILPEVGLVAGVTQRRGGRAQGEAPVDVACKRRRESSSTCCPARCSEDVMYLSARCHHALDVCLHDGATTPAKRNLDVYYSEATSSSSSPAARSGIRIFSSAAGSSAQLKMSSQPAFYVPEIGRPKPDHPRPRLR